MSNVPSRPGARPQVSAKWYFVNAGQQHGPVTAEKLTEMAASGQLQQTDLVWRDGMSQWTEARHVKEIGPPPQAIPGPPPIPSATPAIPPIPMSASQNATAKAGLDRFIPDKFMQLASNPAVAIGVTVALLVLLIFLGSYFLTASLVFASAMLIYFDASSNKIGRAASESASFKLTTNLSPGEWAISTIFLWLVMFPLYFIKRPQLIQTAQTTPQESSGATWKLSVLGVLTALFLLAALFGGSAERAMAEQVVKDGLQQNALTRELGIRSVSLIKESAGNYSGFADTEKGVQLKLKVRVDGERVLWEVQGIGGLPGLGGE